MTTCIVGAGGVGREALDVAVACGLPVDAFLDERLAGSSCRGLPVLALDAASTFDSFLVAVGAPEARARLAAVVAGYGPVPIALVHPAANVAPESVVGVGSLLMAGAYVSSGVHLGPHTQVHYNATVGHDSRLAAFTTVLPGANVAGNVSLGEGATVGSAACVLQGRTVGDGATVGAGAVVTRDVASGVVVVGSPARPLASHGS